MSNIRLADSVYATSNIFFASEKRKGKISKLITNAKLTSLALEHFKNYLNLDRDIKIRFDTISGMNWHGYYEETTRTVTIRYRQNFKSMLVPLAHELVHAEQFKTCKLFFLKTGKRYIPYWCGKKNDSDEAYNYYYNQPWEQEARDRQLDLATLVYFELFDYVDNKEVM